MARFNTGKLEGGVEIDFVVVGACGYMGSNALNREALPELVSTLGNTGIECRLHIAVDRQFIKQSMQERFRQWLHEQTIQSTRDVLLKSDFADALTFIRPDRKTIVYHAAPPQFRLRHAQLLAVNDFNNVYFFGEKPFGFSQEHLTHPMNDATALTTSNLPDRLVFCNFIETENEVFIAAKKYLRDNKCRIRELSFWRAGASGLKHAIQAERLGVSGGALLDKAPHDLALTVALLDSQIESFEVSNAHIERFALGFMPEKNSSDVSPLPWLLDVNNHQVLELNCNPVSAQLTADGITNLSINWRLAGDRAGQEVQANYLVSWLGYTGARFGRTTGTCAEQEFIRNLESFGVAREQWLMQCPGGWGPIKDWGVPPVNANYCTSHSLTHSDQVRIAIIRCDDRTVICNFFRDGDNERAPFLLVHQDGVTTPLPLVDRMDEGGFAARKGKDMHNVLLRIAKHVLEGEPAPYLNKIATLWVHRALFSAQSEALKSADEKRQSLRTWHALSVPTYKWSLERHKRANHWPPPNAWPKM
jgi:hypothetical protein